jgi:signal transduction histidine kinase
LDGPSADGSQSPQSVSQRGVSPALVAHARVSEELRQSEERFRLLVSSVRDYAIFLLDPAGHIVSWNEGARGLAIAAREGRYEVEGWRVRKDGTRFWADVVITALRDGDGVLVGYGKVTRDLTERRQAEEERLELVRERSAREAADRAVELRDEFLSVAAHELKTPVTSLRLYAQATLRRLT